MVWATLIIAALAAPDNGPLYVPADSAEEYAEVEAQTQTPGRVWADGRDRWTLLDRKLQNRQLIEQLDVQPYRLADSFEMFALAADASSGSQVEVGLGEQGRFHGFFIFDSYASFRPLPSIDVNVNLMLLNPSASDGFRFSSQVLPGVGIHFHKDVADVGGHPLRLELAGLDLDMITLGRGLLVEEVPLEGHMASLSWNGIELRETFGGRVFWEDDDLQALSLSILNGALALQYAIWITDLVPPSLQQRLDPTATNVGNGPRRTAQYIGFNGSWAFTPWFRVAGEYLARVRGDVIKNAFLARADFLHRNITSLNMQIHLGYQLRYYQRGFGPRNQLVTPTALPNIPFREDSYATNSFEYLGISQFYDQWSHSVMAEIRVPLTNTWYLMADGEYWFRMIRDPRPGSKRVVFLERGGRAPGYLHDAFYRAGVEYRPWARLPHRLRFHFSNKFVASGRLSVDPDPRRFVEEPLIGVEAEVFL